MEFFKTRNKQLISIPHIISIEPISLRDANHILNIFEDMTYQEAEAIYKSGKYGYFREWDKRREMWKDSPICGYRVSLAGTDGGGLSTYGKSFIICPKDYEDLCNYLSICNTTERM